MSLKRKTASGIGWLSSANLMNQAVSFVVFVVLARDLSFDAFGLVMLAVLIVNIFSLFFKVGVVEYLVKLDAWDERTISTAFWTMAATGCVLTALLAGAVGPLLERYWGGGISTYVGAMSAVVLIGCLSVVNLARGRRDFRFRMYAVRNVGNGVLTGIIAITMAFTGFGAWSLILSRVLGALGAAIILWTWEPYRPRLAFSFSDLRAMVRYSVPVLSSRFLAYLASKTPELLLGTLLGPAALAIYRVGGRIVDTLNVLFLDAIANVLLTTFSRVSRDSLNDAVRRILAAISAIMLPIFVGCAVLAPQLTAVFYGARWEESGWVMMLLCLQIPGLLVRSVMSVVYGAVGKGGRLSSLAAAELVLVGVATLGTAMLGPVAVAGGILLCIHATAALYLRSARGDLDLGIEDVVSAMRPFAIGAFAMGLCVVLFNTFAVPSLGPLLQLISSLLLGTVLYAVFLLLLFPSAMQGFLDEATPLVPKPLALAPRLLQGALRLRNWLRPVSLPALTAGPKAR